MTQNTIRIVTAATIAAGTASAYRDQTALSHFSQDGERDFSELTTNAKAPKPRFEIREEQLEGRNFRMTLVRRNNANKPEDVDSIMVGIYGRVIKPAAPAEAPAETVVEVTPVDTDDGIVLAVS